MLFHFFTLKKRRLFAAFALGLLLAVIPTQLDGLLSGKILSSPTANAIHDSPVFFGSPLLQSAAGVIHKAGSGIVAVSEETCNDGFFLCALKKFFYYASQVFISLVLQFVKLAITFAAGIIDVVIDLNTAVINSPFVQNGFRYALLLANQGFVLAMILIALATIFRVEQYQMKVTLRNLIIAAILINFSLAIAGVFIDFTNVLGNYFIGAATGRTNTGNFSLFLANSLNLQRIDLIVPGGLGGGFAETTAKFGSEFVKFFLTMSFSAVFAVITVVTFLGIALLLVIRYMALIVLLILMPLAWLFWVVPELHHLWNRWWSEFFRWCFFLPAMAFFLFISIISFTTVDNNLNNVNRPIEAFSGIDGLLPEDRPFLNPEGLKYFLILFIKLGFLMQTLIVANKLGIEGAGAAVALAQKGRNMAIGAITGAGKGAFRLGAKGVGAATRTPRKAGAQWLSNRLTSIPGLRRFPGTQRLASVLAGAGSYKEEIEKIKKEKFDKFGNEQLVGMANRQLPVLAKDKSALLAVLAERKLIGRVTTIENLRQLARAERSVNPNTRPRDIKLIKELVTVNPHLAVELTGGGADGYNAEQATHRLSPAEAAKINPDAFDRRHTDAATIAEEIAGLTRAQIQAIVRDGEPELQANIERELTVKVGPELTKLNQEIERFRREITEAQGDPELQKDLQKQRQDTIRKRDDLLAKDPTIKDASEKLAIWQQAVGSGR